MNPPEMVPAELAVVVQATPPTIPLAAVVVDQ